MHHEAKGLFATHLFDGEPLGQTDAASAVISEYASTPTTYAGGVRPPTAPTGSKTGPAGGGATIGGKSMWTAGATATPAFDPSMYPSTQSSNDWVPWAIGGGIAIVALGGMAIVFSGRRTTPNRRRRRR